MYRKTPYVRKYGNNSKKSSSSSSSAPTYYRGYGAYRPRYTRRYPQPTRRYYSGKGAYYLKGGVNAKAKVPYFGQVGGSIEGGYSTGTIKGLGAYSQESIRHNVMIKPDIPQIRNAHYAEGATIIRHREYLGAITTSSVAGEFKIETYPLNPAQSSTFPWLSTIANNYEEYRPNGVFFEFRSTASDAIASSTNLALGQLMMATQYDPTDPGFQSDTELLNYSWAQSAKVSEGVRHFIECDPKQSPLSHLYTRAGAPQGDSDLRFSDFGTFSVATQGLQGTNVQIGQLWVSYEFLLYKPKLGEDQATAGGWFKARNNIGITSGAPFGDLAASLEDPENNLDLTLANAGGVNQRINFPIQNKETSYMVTYHMEGTIGAVDLDIPVFTVSTGVHTCSKWVMNSLLRADYPENSAGATSRAKGVVLIITITDLVDPQFVQFNAGAVLPTGVLTSDVVVTQIPWMDPALY